MPEQPEKMDAVQKMILKQPGGKWLLPHWQDGPYSLVPFDRHADMDERVRILLDAHDPLIKAIPVVDEYNMCVGSVYAFSEYTLAMVKAYETEELGLDMVESNIVAPFPAAPTSQEIVECLPRLIGFENDVMAERRVAAEPLFATLRAANPDLVLATIAGVCPAGYSWAAESRDVLELLTTVVGIITEA